MKWVFALVSLLWFHTNHAQSRKICDLPELNEVSGSIWVGNNLWVLADGGNPAKLYKIDTATGLKTDSTTFSNASNVDWEELATNGQDVFIGDFGNNNGTRKDLRIYRFPLASLGNKALTVDTLSFSYQNQTDFASNPFTIYDCEAMIATDDSLILLSKSYADAICRVYVLPNKSGKYQLDAKDSLALSFWVTGASYYQNIVTMVGYGFNGKLTPALWQGTFENGNLATIAQNGLKTDGPLQVESCINSRDRIFYTAEASNGFNAALFEYKTAAMGLRNTVLSEISTSPNPAAGTIAIFNPRKRNLHVYVRDTQGKIHRNVITQEYVQPINISFIPAGVYTVEVFLITNGSVKEEFIESFKILKEN